MNLSLQTHCFKKESGKGNPDNETFADSVEKEAEDDDFRDILVCSNCHSPITSNQFQTSIKEGHQHRFINPHSIVFNIRCFSRAPGCVNHGEFTDEFSWFPGYKWQIALCGNCHIHLGWCYASADHMFYGLISEKIVELEEEV